VFFVSTGRCGTQWLAKHLAATYADLATVAHEPLHDRYRSRELLACPDLVGAPSEALIHAHANRIERILEASDYVECGWPSWGAIPFLAQRFAGRMQVVHLTRHPVPTACSWVTHGMYRPAVIPGLHPEKVPVSPFDPGAALVEFQEQWDQLDPFQRNLYFWAEVHCFALRCEKSLGLPWFRVRFEELFSTEALSTLAGFLGVPLRSALIEAIASREDEHRSLTDIWWDVGSAARLPVLSELASELGYDLNDVDEPALRRRYLGW
jgi:hypothetical protein